MMRRELCAVVAGVAAFGLFCGTAAADPSVTIVSPSGPQVHASPNDLRTTDQQPTFLIEGSGGSQLSCNFDNQAAGGQFTFGPCGPAPANCPADVCAIYRPSAPLTNGQHSLLAYVEDAGGNVLAQANVDLIVDTTPPDTSLGSLGGTALRPSFSFTIDEDDAFDQGDLVQCSLTPVSAPPAWSTCASGLRGGAGGSFISPSGLLKRHVDYRFEARGVDDFGRPDPTPAQVEFDPVPCTIKAGSITIAELITTGIPLTLSCSYLHDVQLDFFLLGKNGHRRSIGYVVNAFQNLGFQEIKKPAARFTVHRKLRLFKPFAPYFRSYRSAALVIRARDGQGEAGLPAYAVITARR